MSSMSWPLASDFQTILQNPKIAFRDPYLRACSIERDVRGQPRAWAGSFAVVYKGVNAAGTPLAIRVFSTASPHRHGRYDQIGGHVTARRLECLVSFEYREDEIRSLSDGKSLPDRAHGLGRGRDALPMGTRPLPPGRRNGLARRGAAMAGGGGRARGGANRPRRPAARQCHGHARAVNSNSSITMACACRRWSAPSAWSLGPRPTSIRTAACRTGFLFGWTISPCC